MGLLTYRGALKNQPTLRLGVVHSNAAPVVEGLSIPLDLVVLGSMCSGIPAHSCFLGDRYPALGWLKFRLASS